MSFLDDEQIESEAQKFRQRFGFSASEPVSEDRLMRAANTVFSGLTILAAPDEEMMRAAGEADPHQNRIRLRQTVYDRLKRNCGHALEVLVHELCHFHLEHKEVRYRSTVREHSARAAKDEPQAHLMAKAVLAPFDIASASTVECLVDEYRMDRRSAIKRKEKADLMMIRRRDKPRPLPQNVIDFLEAKRAIGHIVNSIP